jgi:hypothetical protein
MARQDVIDAPVCGIFLEGNIMEVLAYGKRIALIHADGTLDAPTLESESDIARQYVGQVCRILRMNTPRKGGK